MSIAVSSFRYCSRRLDEDLKEKLARLAREKPRYDYPETIPLGLQRASSTYGSVRSWRCENV
jgi:hypothetical protein